jgi:hypothetical protein
MASSAHEKLKRAKSLRPKGSSILDPPLAVLHPAIEGFIVDLFRRALRISPSAIGDESRRFQ